MDKKPKATKYVKYRCRLCNRGITLTRKHFELGVCAKCHVDIPDHIPYMQKHQYLLTKILKGLE